MKFKLSLIMVFIVGFVALSYEILWFRIVSYVTGSAPNSFGILLSVYLLGISLGALVSRFWCKKDNRNNLNLEYRLILLFIAASAFSFLVIPVTSFSSVYLNWYWCLPFVAASATLMGAILPLIAHISIDPEQDVGHKFSWLYMSNIAGSTFGSLATGFVLMDIFSIENICFLLLFLSLFVSFIYSWKIWKFGKISLVASFLLSSFGFYEFKKFSYFHLYEKLQYGEKYAKVHQFEHVLENRHGVIAITDLKTVYGGGAYDGKVEINIEKDLNGLSRALFLQLLHPRFDEVLMIGLATGSWAQIVANMPHVKKLTIIEINPGYLELIKKYKDVKSILSNPKVEIIIDDGRRWLNRNPNVKFDTIIQNTTWHWRSHTTNLLSSEYQQLIKSRLKKEGVYFYNTTGSKDVVKTALHNWNYVTGVYNFVAVSDNEFFFKKSNTKTPTFSSERVVDWLAEIRQIEIDGLKVLPGGSETENRIKIFKDILKSVNNKNGWESIRTLEFLKEDTVNASVVTDDNMLSEWREDHFFK